MQHHVLLDISAQMALSGMTCFLAPLQRLEQLQEPQQLLQIAKKVRMEILLPMDKILKVLALLDFIVYRGIDYFVILETELLLLHRLLAQNAPIIRNANLGRIETLKTNINAQLDIIITILRASA